MATDGQTVVRSLKSIFGGSSDGKGKPFIFALSTNLTPVILLIIAGLIFWQRMSNEHINCYAPPEEDIRTAAVNQYCFVTGTYTVLGYPDQLKNLRRNLPYPGVGPRIPSTATNGGGTEVKYHMYFQWVPFVLLAQAILFSVPNLVWKSLRKDSLSRYCNSLMSTDDKTDNGTNNNIKKTSNRFLRNVKHQSSFCRWFIASEILNLAIVVLAFVLSDLLLTGQFFYLGRDWLNHLEISNLSQSDSNHENSSTSPLDTIFPKMSKCEFKKFGPGGSIINYDLLCVMTLNVFHDKVFLLLWFWFVALMGIQSLNLFYQLIILRFRDLQCKLILDRVETAFLDDGNADNFEMDSKFKANAKHFLRTLGFNDWFMLKAISTSVDTEYFTKFFQCLVMKKNSQQENTSRENYLEYRRYAQGETFGENVGGRGMNGSKKHGAYYGENLVNTLDCQNQSLMHSTRNRKNNNQRDCYNQRENLYTHLNQSLKEMRQEQGMEEMASLIDHPHNTSLGRNSVIVNPPRFQQQQQPVSYQTVDMPDRLVGQESSMIPLQNPNTIKTSDMIVLPKDGDEN